VVAGAFSSIHVIAVWWYLYPGAFFKASFVAFITGYHLLLSLVLNWMASAWTFASFHPGRISKKIAARIFQVHSSWNAPRCPWRTSQGVLVPLRDVAGLWETPQVSERWHNESVPP
jgi:hypothetical protein